jgi:alanine racemase
VPELTMPETARAWVDVDLDAVVRNARDYAARVGVPLLPMVKADAYGLGAVAVARALEPLHPWGFGVVTAAEAHALRRAGVERPILICSPLRPDMVEYVRNADARPAIGDLDGLRAWLAAGGGPFHLEVDTGMARNGFPWDDAIQLAAARELLAGSPSHYEGVYTHFHTADGNTVATELQWQRLQQAVTALGPRPRLVHAANSAAGAYGASYGGDLARPGIFLYGGTAGALVPAPVAALRARVVAVRSVPAGATVSYHESWTAPAPTTLATLAIGYADGVLRAQSNRGQVEVHDHVVPIVGRVTMDHLMVDVGDLPVQCGDVATIWGGHVSLDAAAATAGTISYELLTALGPRLPRRHLGGA